ncbi:hypothetical protein [Variovorax sp. dw_308]|uniref:hypothetical protein n=1 Tax=Variovorax sp. dw_308 TaxID=2721546 RepID=UPI001C456271|nr:hypothetical protein [Variovorax sp. dw_308]
MCIQYHPAMRVRIEMRGKDGVWLAKFRKQVEIRGELVCGLREMGGRPVAFVHLSPLELLPNQAAYATPVLFEPKLCAAAGEEFSLQGWEQTEERAWCAQEWDCWLLR